MPEKESKVSYGGRIDLRAEFAQHTMGGPRAGTRTAGVTPTVMLGSGLAAGRLNAVHHSVRELKPGETETLKLGDGSLLDPAHQPVRFEGVTAISLVNTTARDPDAKKRAVVHLMLGDEQMSVGTEAFRQIYEADGIPPDAGDVVIANSGSVTAEFEVLIAGWQQA